MTYSGWPGAIQTLTPDPPPPPEQAVQSVHLSKCEGGGDLNGLLHLGTREFSSQSLPATR